MPKVNFDPSDSPPAIVRPATDLAALAAEINSQHAAGEEASRKGLSHYRAAGKALLKAKAACSHGKWLTWLKQNVRFGQRQAYRYMELAKFDSESNLANEWIRISGHSPTTEENNDERCETV